MSINPLTLEYLAEILEREAAHWTKYPDGFNPRQEMYENVTYSEARREVREWLDTHIHQVRNTHTDIILRDVAARLRRLAKDVS